MRTFIMGLIVGLVLGGGIAFAAARLTLINGSGVEVGTTASPLYIQTN